MAELNEEEKSEVRDWCASELERLDKFGDLTREVCETGEDYYELAKRIIIDCVKTDNAEAYMHFKRTYNLEIQTEEMTDLVIKYIETLDFERL